MSDKLQRITGVDTVQETVAVDLGDYHESYRGATFAVWVTPTKAHKKRWHDIDDWVAQASEETKAALAKLDRQHQAQVAELRREGQTARVLELEKQYQIERGAFDERAAAKMQETLDEKVLLWLADTVLDWSLDEFRTARDHLIEHNPDAWEWLWNRITSTIGEYKKQQLKN